MPISKTMEQLFQGVPKIPQETRKKIFESFLTTPERKEIYEGLAPTIEKELSQKGVEKVYLGGSFVSEKPLPSDIDLFLDVKPSYFHSTFGAPEPPFGLHITPLMPGKTSKEYEKILEEGKKRYGKEYDWVRILGLSGVAGIGALLGKPKEAEAWGPKLPRPEGVKRSVQDILGRVMKKISKREGAPDLPELHEAYISDLPDYFQMAISYNPKNPEKALRKIPTSIKDGVGILPINLSREEAAALSRYIRIVHPGVHEHSMLPKVNERLKKWEKTILGTVIGATTVGAIFGTEQPSEAMPLGKLFPTSKIASKFLKPSSAEEILKGSEVAGKVIKKVHTGKGDWRYLEFEDGTTRALTKDYLNDLSRAIGTKKYLGEATRTKSQTLPMAQRSLETRLNRKQLQNEEEETYKQSHQAYLERVKEIDPTLVPKTVYVKYPANDPNARVITLPEVYADVLEKKGIVTKIGAPKR